MLAFLSHRAGLIQERTRRFRYGAHFMKALHRPASSAKLKSARHIWTGVFPAITTQMHKDGSLDLDATARHAEALLASGITGLIFLGSLGENQMLTAEEKRLVMR